MYTLLIFNTILSFYGVRYWLKHGSWINDDSVTFKKVIYTISLTLSCLLLASLVAYLGFLIVAYLP